MTAPMTGKLLCRTGGGRTQVGSLGGARRPDQGGFTLLEVLVATTLMGLVLVVLLQVLTTAMRAQETSWGHTQALMVAEKVLQENCGLVQLESKTFQGREGSFDYLVRITPQYEMDAGGGRQIRCAIIGVQVTWRERGRLKTLALQTVRTAVQRHS